MRTLLVILLSLVLCGCAGMYASQEVREKYIGYFPHLSAETKANILSGKISIGMTMEEVKASWNDWAFALEHPQTRTCSAFGCVEMYKCGNHYLTFMVNKLTDFTSLCY